MCFFSVIKLLHSRVLKVVGSHINKPLWFYNTYISHILFRSEYQALIDNPFRLFIEQRRRWVNKNSVIINNSLVPLLRVLFRSVIKESGRYGFSDLGIVFITRTLPEFVPIHDLNKLFSYVKCFSHRLIVNKIFVTPDRRLVILNITFVHVQHC